MLWLHLCVCTAFCTSAGNQGVHYSHFLGNGSSSLELPQTPTTTNTQQKYITINLIIRQLSTRELQNTSKGIGKLVKTQLVGTTPSHFSKKLETSFKLCSNEYRPQGNFIHASRSSATVWKKLSTGDAPSPLFRPPTRMLAKKYRAAICDHL